MGFLDDVVSVPRRTLTLIFIVNSSSSMNGPKIGAVNDTIANLLPMLDEISTNNPDVSIKFAVLQYSDTAAWHNEQPMTLSDFIWKGINAEGLSMVGPAFEELNNKLSRSEYMYEPNQSFAPILVWVTDTCSVDDYHVALKQLKLNSWYKAAIKFAIAVGNSADIKMLEDFTGDVNKVFSFHNIEELSKSIRIVAVSNSQIGTVSRHSCAPEHIKQDNNCFPITLKNIVNAEGSQILLEKRIINILNDLRAFDDAPAKKQIITTMISSNYMKRLLEVGVWNLKSKQLVEFFTHEMGFKREIVYEVFRSIAYSLGWKNLVEVNEH